MRAAWNCAQYCFEFVFDQKIVLAYTLVLKPLTNVMKPLEQWSRNSEEFLRNSQGVPEDFFFFWEFFGTDFLKLLPSRKRV